MERSEEIWQHFKSLLGSEGIASKHAIKGLIETIKRKRPEKILELGAGIGTLTYTILASLHKFFGEEYNYTFYTVENNEFCIGQLKKNLKDFEGKYIPIDNTLKLASKNIKFDLIVIDGGGVDPGDTGPMTIENMVGRQGVIFIEGYRKYQRDMIKKWYQNRNFVCVNIRTADEFIKWKDIKIRGKNYWLYQFEPTILQKLKFFILYIWWDKLIKIRRKLKGILS